MRFVIITGMSGAGKSTALKMLEDMGYFCVDNLPIALLGKFAELAGAPGGEINKVALGVDIRSGQALGELETELEKLAIKGLSYEILFLDASDSVLVKRYKETRRSHPLAKGGRVDKGIQEEREKLAFLKKHADYILDTSQLLTRELNQELDKIFMQNQDCDLVFDVRFLPNPFYVDDLKQKTGNDKEVQDYVMGFEVSHVFLNKLTDMLEFLIPNYVLEGKNQLVIGVGCTGGKHRSVTLANRLYEALNGQKEYGVRLEHRDIRK